MIVVAGESLVDLLVRPDGSVEAVPGGGPYNAARALGRLGLDVAFIGRLSTDRFGRILRDRLLTDRVDLRWAVETDEPTLLAIAELDEAGAAAYRFHAAETAAVGLSSADLPAELPATVVAVHVGTLGLVFEPMADAMEALVARVPDDAVVLLDPNIRPAAIRDEVAYRVRLHRVLARADVVKASVEDLAWLVEGADPLTAARGLLAQGPRAVLVTDGPNPVRIVAAGTVEQLPVPPIAIVDTVGAGDAFGAGFLAAWAEAGHGRAALEDMAALRAATAVAIRVGSMTAARTGAEPPTRAELELRTRMP